MSAGDIVVVTCPGLDMSCRDRGIVRG